MYCGNKEIAIKELSETLFEGIKKGWPAGRPECWTWKSSSEIKLLEQIKEKANTATYEILEDFVDLPVTFWGWVSDSRALFPVEKILEISLATLEIFWSNRNVYTERRIKSIKKELTNSLLLLELSWRKDHDQENCSGGENFRTKGNNRTSKTISSSKN